MKLSIKMGMLLMFVVILAVSGVTPITVKAEVVDKIQKIDQFVEEQRKSGLIPGISVVIVEKGKTVYQKGFGYANIKRKAPVTANTLFELGSTTKAFTALAILQLEKEGLIKRTDDVQKYIPWLKLSYQGEPQTITLEQLVHHTSGIATNTITRIPESNANNALELTVKTLQNQQLNRKPGSSYQYATLNYDVLGLVIENVTKKPYDRYIKEHILEPIGMKDSYVGLHQAESVEIATGYKIGFMREQAYTPPIYRGNIPAGYIISHANDIAKWLNLQLGNHSNSSMDKQLIIDSHIPDKTVAPFDKNTHYAYGWGILEENNKPYILHAGDNPTYSSYFIMQPDEQLGVAVMANMRTSVTTAIGQGVMDLWEGKPVNIPHMDSFQKLDQIVTIICIVVGGLGVFFILLTLSLIRQIAQQRRKWTSLNGKRITLLVLHLCIVAAGVVFMMMIPKLLLGGVPWSFLHVWGPTTFSLTLYSALAVSAIFLVFGLLLVCTKNTKVRKQRGSNM